MDQAIEELAIGDQAIEEQAIEDQAIAQKIMTFLAEIEVPFTLTAIEQKTFLPGLLLQHGVLQIDLEKLVFPGDILHEAGHIAICEPKERQF